MDSFFLEHQARRQMGERLAAAEAARRVRASRGDTRPRPALVQSSSWAQRLGQVGNLMTLLALPLLAGTVFEATPFQVGVLAVLELLPFLLAGVWPRRLAARWAAWGWLAGLGALALAASLGASGLLALYAVAPIVSGLAATADRAAWPDPAAGRRPHLRRPAARGHRPR